MTAHTRLTPDQPIPIDLECGRCNYNLRGLMLQNDCPECGRPIRETLPGDGDVLVYQWTEEAIKRQSRRTMIPIMLVFYLIGGSPFAWLFASQWLDPSANQASAPYTVLVGMVPFLIAFSIMIYFLFRRRIKSYSSYKLILTECAIAQLAPPLLFLMIPRHRLLHTHIIPFGLIVRSDDRYLTIPIAKGLPGYEEITSQLEKWGVKPDRKRWWVRSLLIPSLLFLLCFGALSGLTGGAKMLQSIALMILSGVFAWDVYKMFYNRELAPVPKIILMIFFAAMSLGFLIYSLVVLFTS